MPMQNDRIVRSDFDLIQVHVFIVERQVMVRLRGERNDSRALGASGREKEADPEEGGEKLFRSHFDPTLHHRVALTSDIHYTGNAKHFSRPVGEGNEAQGEEQNRVDTRRELLYQRAVASELSGFGEIKAACDQEVRAAIIFEKIT